MNGEKQIPVHGFTNLSKTFFLQPGIPLQIEIDDVAVKMNSVSVGYVAEKCLIIKYPNTGSFGPVSNKLFKGNRITVRYVDDGNVFGFQSELLGVSTDPVRLLFLEYPKTIAHHSLRANKRVGCYLPANLVVTTRRKDFSFQGGIVGDISESGCNYCLIKEFPDMPFPDVEVGDDVILSLQLPGTENEVQLPGNVRRIEGNSRKIGVGVQFHDITEGKKKGILNYIATVRRFLDEEPGFTH